MHLWTILGFMAVTTLAVATPGPDVILAMAKGSRYGLRRAVPGLLAVLCSDLLMVGAVAAGLGAALIDSAFWFSVVKGIGAAYLSYMGLRLILTTGTLSTFAPTQTQPDAAPNEAVAWRSFVVAVTNPKAYVFFAALLPQFVDASAPPWPQYAVLAVTFAAVELSIMIVYAMAGRRLFKLLSARRVAWVERGCGVGLLAAAASLLIARRAAAAT